MNTKKYIKKSFLFCNFEKQNIENKMTISAFITSLSFERKNNRSGKILAKKRGRIINNLIIVYNLL